MGSLSLPEKTAIALDDLVTALQSTLLSNLDSCVLYGSAVRGGFVEGTSNINLLIVLEESTPEAHHAIAETLENSKLPVMPFVLGRKGIDRSFECFALKFRSIQRSYTVLFGRDPLQGQHVSEETLRFECEQALRNLRLRCVHSFIRFGHHRPRYTQYLRDIIADVFVYLSETLRLSGIDVPRDYGERLPLFREHFGNASEVLKELLILRRRGGELISQPYSYHARLYALLTTALDAMEKRWPS